MPRLGVAEQTAFVREHADDVARSLLAEDALPARTAGRALVVLIGLPASGKSHFGRLLARRLGAVVVATDELRRRILIAPSYVRVESRAIFALGHAVVRRLLAGGHAVVWDATDLRERDRRPLLRLARDAGAAVVLVRVIAPEDVVRARLAGRAAHTGPEDASDADWSIYLMMRDRYEPPAAPVIEVDSSADLEPALERVAAAVRAAGG